jgi:hypothetical protein
MTAFVLGEVVSSLADFASSSPAGAVVVLISSRGFDAYFVHALGRIVTSYLLAEKFQLTLSLVSG